MNTENNTDCPFSHENCIDCKNCIECGKLWAKENFTTTFTTVCKVNKAKVWSSNELINGLSVSHLIANSSMVEGGFYYVEFKKDEIGEIEFINIQVPQDVPNLRKLKTGLADATPFA